MAKKKTVNWAAIKKRYLQGEKPKAIAEEYGLTAKQVSNRAQQEDWTSKKQQISAKVEKKIEDEFERIQWRLLKEYERLAFSDMRNVAEWNQSGIDLKQSAGLSTDFTASVASLSEHTNNQGTSVKIKLHSKTSAMDSLAEIVGLLKKKEQKDSKETGESEEKAARIEGLDIGNA